MMQFAKLFETQDLGQILAFLDKNDQNRPCLRVMFHSPKFHSMVTVTASYSDSAEGHAEAERRLELLSEDDARKIALDWNEPQ